MLGDTMPIERSDAHAEHHGPLSRRRGRQPAAHRRPSRTRAPSARRAQITADQLAAVEDEEIKKIIRKQEEVGLQLATDGEFRRSWWHFDFFWKLEGCERVVLDHGIQFHGVADQAGEPARDRQARFSR